jgi:RHS repeat-associated protein
VEVYEFGAVAYAPPAKVLAVPGRAPLAYIFSNATFVYDGDGKRVKSTLTTDAGVTTTYFVGNYYEVTGTQVTKYYYAGSQRIAMRKNGTLNFILGDHLGSTSLVTDAAGNMINQTQYKAWGEVRYSSGTKQTNYGFTGQYSESDFGLQFYNARWYDSYITHFTQPDTIVPNPSNPQDYDRYSYGLNNPSRYTDPTGHSVDCGLGDPYCEAGKINVQKRANDLTRNLPNSKGRNWISLSDSEKSILSEGGWDEGSFNDKGGVSDADALHDPATYIVAAVALTWRPVIIWIGAELATQNPDGTYTIIGGYPKYEAYAKANGYTYFSLGDAYRPLNALGLAEPINKQFISNQIAQAKDFVQVSLGGKSTAMEVALITSKGLYTITELGSLSNSWSNFTAIFTYTP